MSKEITKEQQAIIYEALGESFKKIVNDPRMKDANPDMFAHAWLSMAVYNVNVGRHSSAPHARLDCQCV